ncbi:flagellar export chaperone FliS [Aeromonas bestiarum]|uniref:flagellar export chaperone FliS n=1 Tax=Aeromonas bestiarum TaxID=105751 RepID=UPI002379BE92|nr:flagellar export chaperone FliS [Aeromonas bestiarum]EKP0277410.1 flagellar export chaperone FliS [Aeromonas bestiarum]WDL81096.1 flagellar export chaperone FliS [Aeromonas bestiarum]
MYHKSIKAYTSQNLQAEMAVADPYRVIQLMLQGGIERLSQAKGAIERKDYEGKSIAISKSLAIINGLQDSLNLSYGEIPENLFSLYEYMKSRLFDASRDMSSEPIDEVAILLGTIKSAWDSIPVDERARALSQQASL